MPTPSENKPGSRPKRSKKIIAAIALPLALGAIILAATFAASPVSWVTTSSTNCLTQGAGNTMVEVNSYIYILSGGTTNFRRYNPATGTCDSSSLAAFPATVAIGASMEKIDNNTIMAITGGSNSTAYFYNIPNDLWINFTRGKADDTATTAQIGGSSLPSVTQGVGNSIVQANSDFYILDGNSTNFRKYSVSGNSYSSLAALPASAGSGAALAYPGTGDFIYAFRGAGTATFYKYCMTGSGCTINTWTTLTSAPGNVNAGGALSFVGTTDLYAFGGGGSKYFWKYNTGTATWTDLTSSNPIPDLVQGGGALTTIGTNLYALQGNNTKAFWKYNTSTTTWSTLANTPDRVAAGGSLTSDGTNMYATRGKNTKEFWKYTTASNTWSILKDTPLGFGTSSQPTHLTTTKGGIAYIASGPSGAAEIYAVSGNGVTASAGLLFRYKIATNTWPTYEAIPTSPASFSYGASLVYPSGSGDFVYALRGITTKTFWKYMLSQNIWVPWNRGKFDSTNPVAVSTNANSQGVGNHVVEAGGKLYSITTVNATMQAFDTVNNVWKDVTAAPASIAGSSTDAALVKYDDSTLYVLGGGSSFWKYDIPNETWFDFTMGKTTAGKPISQLGYDDAQTSTASNLDQGIGNSIVEISGKMYILPGGSTTNFLRYDPSTNSWLQLAAFPAANGQGSAMVTTDSNTIYAFNGNSSTAFYKYDLPSNTWTTMAVAPGAVNAGAALAYPGSGNFIYAFRGRNNSGAVATNEFYRYSISGNSWTDLTSTSPPPSTVQAGGALVAFNSTDLYAFGGNGTTNFWKFTITNSPSSGDGTWTDLTSSNPAPATVQSGGSLTTDGTYIYATRGANTTTFWKYDPAAASGSRWSTLNAAPVAIGSSASSTTSQGGIAYSATLGDLYAVPGNGFGSFFQGGPAVLFRYQLPASSGSSADDNTWPTVDPTADPPAAFNHGVSLTYPGSGNLIYAFRGNTTADFWAYDVSTNEWKVLYRSKFDDGTALSQNNSSVTQGVGNTLTEVSGSFYILAGGSATNFQKFTPSTNTWTDLADAPATIGSGASIIKKDANTLYVLRGGNNTDFWKYDITTDTWFAFPLGKKDDETPFSQDGTAQGAGNRIVKVNNAVSGDPEFYITAGGTTKTFEKYNPTTNTWTTLAQAPVNINYGGSLVAVGTTIYAFVGGNSTAFYSYDTLTDTWSSALAVTPGAIGGGGSLAYPGSGDYIYALRGNAQSSFWRYSISGNSWSANAFLANTPAVVNAGGALAFVGTDLYAFGGYVSSAATGNFWKYDTTQDPTTGTWTTLTSSEILPETVASGGTLTSDGTYLYATPGQNSTAFWKYDPGATTGSRWTKLDSVPSNMGESTITTSACKGGTVYCSNCGSGEIWAVTGNGRNAFSASSSLPLTGGLVFRYKIGTGTWAASNKTIAAPDTVNYGGALTYPGTGDLLYALRGGATNDFWTYDTASNEWNGFTKAKLDTGKSISQQGTAQGVGNAITQVGGLFYILAGNSVTFQSYDPVNNIWKTLTNAPAAAGSGAALVSTDSNTIYAFRGAATNTFWKYTISSGIWTAMATAPTTVEEGGSLAYPGSGNLVYAFGGNSTTGFWVYSISGNTWDSSTPTAAPATVGGGGALIGLSGNIFAFRGNTSSTFWKYTITNATTGAGSWVTTDPTDPTWTSSGSVTSGGALATDGTNIYAAKGDGDPDIRKYTVASNSWSSINNFPTNIGTNSTATAAKGGLAYVTTGPSGGGELYGVSGNGITSATGIGLIYRYPVTGTNANTWPTLTGPGTSTPADAPATVSYGGALTSLINGSNYEIYALRGGATVTFWRFVISDTATGAGAWNAVDPTDLSVTVGSGGSLTNDGSGNIYATRGSATNEVYRYSVSGNTWSALAPSGGSLTLPTPITSVPLTTGSASTNEARGAIAYSSTLNALYLVTGNGVTGTTTSSVPGKGLLFRYPFTGINAETWPLSYTPPAQPTSTKTVLAGGSLVSTDSDSIFAFRGNNTNEFWRYDISANSWNLALTAPPTGTGGTNTVGPGGSLTTDGAGNIYATRGSPSTTQTKDFWKYTISDASTGAGTWSSLTSAPVAVGTTATTNRGGVIYYNGNVWMVPGYGQNTFTESTGLEAGLLYRYDVASNTWPNFSEVADVSEGVTNGAFYGGSDLAATTDGLTLFALQGNATTPRLWQYTISNDTWTQKTVPTAAIQSGGSIVAADADNLYALRGGSTTDVYKYAISSNTWSAAPTFPVNVGVSPASATDDRGELIFSSSTNRLFATPGSDTVTPFSIYSLAASPRTYISAVTDPGNGPTFAPRAGENLDVVVQAVDENGNAYTVATDTAVTLALVSGNGTVGGTITGTIAAGLSQVTISNVTYSAAESGVVIKANDTTASNPSHVTLAAEDSSSFTVAIGPVSASNSTFTTDISTIVANGTNTATMTVTLKDNASNVIAGKVVSLSQVAGAGSATITAVACVGGDTPGTTNASGQACFTATATTPGTVTLRATDTTDTINITTQVTLTFQTTDATQSTFTASAASLTANGTSTVRLTATLKTTSSTNVSGKTVTVAQTSGPGSVTITAVTCASGGSAGISNSSGQACFDISSTLAQTGIFQATDTSSSIVVTQTASVVFNPGTASADSPYSTVSGTPSNVDADGLSTSAITVLLRDANNNVLTGKDINLTKTSGAGTPTITEVNCPDPEPAGSGVSITNTNGKACFTIKSITSGTVTLTATDATDSITLTQTLDITFDALPPADNTNSTFDSSPSSALADGSTTVTLTATLLDASSNPLVSKVVTAAKTSGTGTPTITAVNCQIADAGVITPGTTNFDGQACFTAAVAIADTYVFAATDTTDSLPAFSDTASVSFTGPTAAASTVTASDTTIIANSISSSLVTVTLKDGSNNVFTGRTTTLTDSDGNATITAVNCQASDVGSITPGVSNSLGKVCFLVKSDTVTSPATSTFTAINTTDNPDVTVTQNVNLEFTIGLVDTSTSSFNVSPSSLIANGSSLATATATLKDMSNNLLEGLTVNFSQTSGPSALTLQNTDTDTTASPGNAGKATFQVSTITAGTYVLDASVNTPIYDTTTYTETTTAPNLFQGTASTLIAGSRGDNVQGSTTLPFNFSLYGTNVTAGSPIYLCSNGYIRLTSGATCPAAGALTSGIAGFYMDLITNGSGQTGEGIYKQVAADNNAVTFLWVAEAASDQQPITFEITLYRNHQIEFHYNETSGKTPVAIGLYNGSSTLDSSGLSTPLSTDHEATRFEYSVTTTDVSLGTITITFQEGLFSPTNSTFTASSSSVAADGTTTSTLTVTLKDANNNLVTNTLVEINDDGSLGDIDYLPINRRVTTNGSGVGTLTISSTERGIYTFTATADPLGQATDLTQTAEVEFTCVIGQNQQCLELSIQTPVGGLSLTTPDSFAFSGVTSSADDQESFSKDDDNYQLNSNDVVTVQDLRGSSGFTLQVTASPFTAGGPTIPLQNLHIVTTAASTGGTQNNGVEYRNSYSGPMGIIAPLNTSGSLVDSATFLTDGSPMGLGNIGTPIEIMRGDLNPPVGRIGTFKQNINYYLNIPGLQPPGDYSVTFTFDLIDS